MRRLLPWMMMVACSRPENEAKGEKSEPKAEVGTTGASRGEDKVGVSAPKKEEANVRELPEPAYTVFVPLGTKADDVKLECPPGTKQTRIDDEIACRKFDPTAKGSVPPKIGPAVHFHASGAIASQGRYEDNKREGVWVEWDEQGNKVAVKTWKRGEQDGLSITWWANGKRQSQIEFAAGKIHGTSTTWGDDGKPLAWKRYESGELRETTAFDASGDPRKL